MSPGSPVVDVTEVLDKCYHYHPRRGHFHSCEAPSLSPTCPDELNSGLHRRCQGPREQPSQWLRAEAFPEEPLVFSTGRKCDIS